MVSLQQVVEAMRVKGEEDEADYLELMIPLELMVLHGFSFEEVMEMSMDDVEAWYNTSPKPIRYAGWNFWWGEAA